MSNGSQCVAMTLRASMWKSQPEDGDGGPATGWMTGGARKSSDPATGLGRSTAMPSRNRRGSPLYQIPGMTPSLIRLPRGCAFRDRCERAQEACGAEPRFVSPVEGREVSCFFPHVDEAP